MTNCRNFLKITMLNDANYISFETEKSSSTSKYYQIALYFSIELEPNVAQWKRSLENELISRLNPGT